MGKEYEMDEQDISTMLSLAGWSDTLVKKGDLFSFKDFQD